MPNSESTAEVISDEISMPEILDHLVTLYSSVDQERCNKITRTSFLKALLYLVAINAGLPFFAPAKKFAGDDETLGIFYGVSIYLCIGSISVWAVSNYLTNINLINKTSKTNGLVQSICAASAFILAVCSALPGALISMRYNPLWILGFSIFFDVASGSISFYEMCLELYNDRYAYKNKKSLRDSRNQLIRKLPYGISNIDAPHGLKSKEWVISDIKRALALATPKLRNQQTRTKSFNCFYQIMKPILYVSLPLSWACIAAYLVYNAMQDKLKLSEAPSGFIALATTVPSYYLELLFANKLIDILYTSTINNIFDINKPNPLMTHYPTQTKCWLIFTSALACFSFAGRAQVVKDLLSPSSFRDFLITSVSIGTVFFKISAMVENIFGIGTTFAAQHSSEYVFKRQIVFNRFRTMLRICEPREIEALLPLIDEPSTIVEPTSTIDEPSTIVELTSTIDEQTSIVPSESHTTSGNRSGMFFQHASPDGRPREQSEQERTPLLKLTVPH